jgi:aminopeptidase N
MKLPVLLSIIGIGMLTSGKSQLMEKKEKFTEADSLRGSLNPRRTWWNVLRYDIVVQPDISRRTITGNNRMTFSIAKSANEMQIDLQQPMQIDSIVWNYSGGIPLSFTRRNNIALVVFPQLPKELKETSITIFFSGKPIIAVRPPWDGGWIWTKDEQGNPWISVACQGLGASVWYPCKDHQSDEPDRGATLTMVVPETLTGVANGRLIKEEKVQEGLKSFTWEVTNPINNYNLIPYIGKYTSFNDTLQGEKGKLDLSYWVLEEHLGAAKKQFIQSKTMLRAFEYWLGPYPFYEDGYKLVESPHLGMEHQSAIAYGNKFLNGYMGMDLSRSGWGLKWDYIIIHESGHEWFANNITSNDMADMWIHEGYTTYTETLYTEYLFGQQAGNEYNYGLREGIENQTPIVGPYGVNKEGSSDMYPKAANMIHSIRHALNNDSIFRSYLRALNKEFYHSQVDYADIEKITTRFTGWSVAAIFRQYLTTTKIPRFAYALSPDGKTLYYRWENCQNDFDLPVWINSGYNGEKKVQLLPQSNHWKKWNSADPININSIREIEKMYYCTLRQQNITDEMQQE